MTLLVWKRTIVIKWDDLVEELVMYINEWLYIFIVDGIRIFSFDQYSFTETWLWTVRCVEVSWKMDWWTQTDRQISKQTDEQADRYTDRQTDTQTDRQQIYYIPIVLTLDLVKVLKYCIHWTNHSHQIKVVIFYNI